MDLNPQTPDWSVEEGPYELAQHCIETKTQTLLLLNAWLDSHEDSENDIDYGTLNYWALRLRPLWSRETLPRSTSNVDEHQTNVVICNRSGEEDGEPHTWIGLPGHH
jgi:protein N-terminal amidase